MSEQLLLTGHIEPWRCQSCKKLMYNLDENGYPAPGAPETRYFSADYDKICSMCIDMAFAADTEHFRKITAKKQMETSSQ